jgi:hypothetical protein
MLGLLSPAGIIARPRLNAAARSDDPSQASVG